MEKRWTWLVLVMIALVAFAGCSDDDDPVTPPAAKSAFQTLAEAGTAYINNANCPGVISAADLNSDLSSYTVIDIRQPVHYAAGHINGAYNSSLGTLLNDLSSKAIPSDKDYVIACYSGQSAGHAKIAMELMGYGEVYRVYSLLYGMSSWSYDTSGSWENNTADHLANPETANNNGNLVDHAFPALEGNASTIVADRVAWMLQNGFKGINYTDIEANLGDYFIINYFGEADYLGQGTAGVPGHIPGAFQFTPKASLGYDQMLKHLPTDMPIVVYCWTGQHSSQITAYLNMLGYEAYSLKFGSNNLFHSSLTAHQWNATQMNDFAMDAGFTPGLAFSAMAAAGGAYINGADCPGIIDAPTLNSDLEAYTVIDIRAQDAYDAGHIVGAYHSSLSTLVADMLTIPTGKPYVIACYSGQSAGHAKVALEMLGYDEVYSLKWGMSSWSSRTEMQAPWTNNCANNLTSADTTPENDNLTWHQYPVLTENVATVVENRAEAMLAAGFKGVNYADIEANLEDYFIINYFGEADYLGQGTAGVPGHIPGAFQFTPKASLGIDQMLGQVPADMPVVVYCWTGQHSSQITAYLNMLGYEAYSLKFGSNNLFYDNLTEHKWVVGTTTNDYPLHNDTVAVH